ncbi:16S/23S rRNA (cytidine-2'-O)-methyltransferase TlyA [uncultured Alphaproteobacteria bacterium]|uniref:16S/23S rRNA (Cytidine-2'-O)-methyltransferase TlyA n=1 Tax=uncultured Alphaproteobacteria bacterium TaxID=91750 RepID=A0A212JJ43_9PROT|nr:16S/23S rRNA (cytidine-2'-O)-methyltransferase TlyA [uncultured Alphaproteobacteria bacterium]
MTVRADQALVVRGLAPSRARARMLIEAGAVFVNGAAVDKASRGVGAGDVVEVRGAPIPWVSRGGLKLAHGLAHFGYEAAGRVCLDVGASTGGFTDVLRQAGAARIYAVDVGHDQLAAELRADPRVVSLEGVNARTLSSAEIPEPVGVVVCDASFIALQTVLEAPLALAAPGAWAIALVKPQFQVGPKRVGKGGVVRDPALRQEACDAAAAWFAAQGWAVDGVAESPITGPDGNVEFLLGARK